METILDRILEAKRKEVKILKERANPPLSSALKHRSFLAQLEKSTEMSIIAEFKRASPSKGNLNLDADPRIQAKIYMEAGADAVSVLTDHAFFKGSLGDLEAVRLAIDKPVLCKDFIIDPIQIDAAKGAGADIILLIAAALADDKLHELYEYAQENGLEVLMEVHDEREAERVLKTDNRLIGINNRNLKTFEVDLAVTESVAPIIKKEGRFLISESGIKTIEDVERVQRAGANGILVGETFMTHSYPAQVIKAMKLPLKTEVTKK